LKFQGQNQGKLTFIKSLKRFLSRLHRFDELDMNLLFELTKDGSISVPALSKKLDINASVLYSRIKRLMKKKLIKKFTIVIDDSLLGIGVKATVGINRDPKLKDSIREKLLSIPEVVLISEVTGRFDMLIKVYSENLEELHTIVIEKLGKIEGIQNTETFVELQKIDKDPIYLKK
jgi:Lrp/AsnC family transcriptional regulator for asnA, asnC and gidA